MRPLLASAATVLGGLTLALSSVTSAQAAASYTVVGNDLSWPQCVNDTSAQGPLPSPGAFGIVGVNDGLANTSNPCFGTELAWAQKAAGTVTQPAVQLYVNTADPGKQAAYWPRSNVSQLKTPVQVPAQYGTCTGKPTSAACAYVYGWSMAENDARIRTVSNPGSYFWWLDVETDATWSKTQATNRAVLEGMVTYLESINTTAWAHNVGVYSTPYQWGRIAGTAPSGSPLLGLPSWLAGAGSKADAATRCTSAGLTPGSQVRLVQYLPGGLDDDLSCTD